MQAHRTQGLCQRLSVYCSSTLLHHPEPSPAVFANTAGPALSACLTRAAIMRGDIVSVDVDRSQIVWMALAGCALGPHRKNPAAIPPSSLVPVRCLAVATMFCVDLVAAVRLKAEKMAKERKDARALRWTGRLTRTASKRLSKPPSQKEIESNLSKGSREVQPRPAPSLRPGPYASHPARALCACALFKNFN